ncbi:hypothetical protein K1719_037150 [Acacia pycnantha]|nr:hypothetical protein K1719_037150 [Acacia pycnantha]
MSKPEDEDDDDSPSRPPVIRGVAGDGRCLFRAVVYGACLRSGDPSPTPSKEKQLADDLRNKVVDEFIKRRAKTEWFRRVTLVPTQGKCESLTLGEESLNFSCPLMFYGCQ